MPREMRPSFDKPVDTESPMIVPKQDEDKSEVSRGNSVMEDIERSINKAAGTYNLPPDLIRGVIKAESDFQVKAESKAGARGLMQLMPATAEELGVKDPYDIDQNIDGGTRYLKRMMDRFGSDLKKALAAYNAGPGTVERYGGRVPYQETRQYVQRVLEFSGLEA
ncbi:MAG: lytic transglycosylase domain-containing protein [Deltaproteobacteria bacterium]|nr:lytic transglycosylase domain-containing protein [Deltaproteobacteria bacterium]